MKTKIKISALLAAMTVTAGMAVAQRDTIRSAKVSAVPSKDVKNEAWNKAAAVTVNVLPQNVTAPMLLTASVPNVKVKCINDGTTIAFLLEWTDSTRNSIVEVDKFCDQVAVQFPSDSAANPNFMMGNKGGMPGRVHIIHWKAVWQDDIEKGYRDVKDAYPNYWTDIYPMKEKEGDGSQGKFARDVKAADYANSPGKNFMHGAYAGNPVSIFDRKNPSEEAVAEGYGSFTTQPVQNAGAWGVWENNTWKVIITRPLISSDKDDAVLGYVKGKMAFAVWNGAYNNISGRKHYSMWIPYAIEK